MLYVVNKIAKSMLLNLIAAQFVMITSFIVITQLMSHTILDIPFRISFVMFSTNLYVNQDCKAFGGCHSSLIYLVPLSLDTVSKMVRCQS